MFIQKTFDSEHVDCLATVNLFLVFRRRTMNNPLVVVLIDLEHIVQHCVESMMEPMEFHVLAFVEQDEMVLIELDVMELLLFNKSVKKMNVFQH